VYATGARSRPVAAVDRELATKTRICGTEGLGFESLGGASVIVTSAAISGTDGGHVVVAGKKKVARGVTSWRMHLGVSGSAAQSRACPHGAR
jgi:hypothetical protein